MSKTYVQKEACTETLIAVLFITVKSWKQPRYPLTNKWLNELDHPLNGILLINIDKQAIKLWMDM